MENTAEQSNREMGRMSDGAIPSHSTIRSGEETAVSDDHE